MLYAPNGLVISQTTVRRERWPGGHIAQGMPLVSLGQEILPGQPVLRLQQLVATEGFANRFHTLSPARTAVKSEILIAGLHGRITQFTRYGGVIIESHVALLRGSFGIGRQIAGVLTLWQSDFAQTWQRIPRGAILVVPGPLNFALLEQAVNIGVAGIVASGIALRDLERFLQTDLIAIFASDRVEQALSYLPPITLLLTEGLGTMAMAMPIMHLFSHYQNSIALLEGRTSVQRRIFPELLISVPLGQRLQPDLGIDTTLASGALVRVRGGEKEGSIGIIDYLFSYEQRFRSGIYARAARLRLDDGSHFVVPLTLIERIS